jgi:hypothetical protein
VRHGPAVALLTNVFGALAARGDSKVTCEVDTNAASNVLVTTRRAHEAHVRMILA